SDSDQVDVATTDNQYAGLLEALDTQNSQDAIQSADTSETTQNGPKTPSSEPFLAPGGKILGSSTSTPQTVSLDGAVPESPLFASTSPSAVSTAKASPEPVILRGGGVVLSQFVAESASETFSDSSEETSTSTASSTPPVAPEQDTTSPDVHLAVEECANSFSSDGCLVPAGTLHISIISNAEDLDSFSLSCKTKKRVSDSWAPCDNFSYDNHATTSALDATGGLYELRASAKDTAGNESAEVSKAIEVNSSPVVINEIAWAGTGLSASTSKERWLELYNRSNLTLNMSGWELSILRKDSLALFKKISLGGIIAGKSYFLIEDGTDDVLPDISADFIASFGGTFDIGMVFSVEKGGVVIDRTPQNCSRWCGGDPLIPSTMERIEPDGSGESVSNWGTYGEDDMLRTHKNRDGGEIFGTPKGRNSLNYRIASDGFLDRDRTITK
ncbi:MAG: hypothetical protein HYW88_02655, partial [Candidatus Sungbacteria bacterium]|nr:hypothetical protein [Candidatus Sungbacteria bacterium]